jgi:hypothetical protein
MITLCKMVTPSQLQSRRNSLWCGNFGTQSILICHPCNNSLKQIFKCVSGSYDHQEPSTICRHRQHKDNTESHLPTYDRQIATTHAFSPAFLPDRLTKYPHNHPHVPSIHHAAQSFCIIAWCMHASAWFSVYLSIFSSSFHLPGLMSACLRTCFRQRKQKPSVRIRFQLESRLCAFLTELQIKCWATAFFLYFSTSLIYFQLLYHSSLLFKLHMMNHYYARLKKAGNRN